MRKGCAVEGDGGSDGRAGGLQCPWHDISSPTLGAAAGGGVAVLAAENESSNWREFTTLVHDMEYEEKEGRLNEAWVVMATDSTTVEGCLYKGNSSSEKLFDLIVRLRAIELRTGARFLITHVSGKRMIAQGTDGVSRGTLKEGVCLGQTMRSFCPWGNRPFNSHQSCWIG